MQIMPSTHLYEVTAPVDPLIEKWAVLFKFSFLACHFLQAFADALNYFFDMCVLLPTLQVFILLRAACREIKWIQFTELLLERTSCILIIQGLKDNGLITTWFQIKERKTCDWRMDKIESFLPAAQRLDLLIFVVIVLGKRVFLYFFSHSFSLFYP